jgi:hypothetical protein
MKGWAIVKNAGLKNVNARLIRHPLRAVAVYWVGG